MTGERIRSAAAGGTAGGLPPEPAGAGPLTEPAAAEPVTEPPLLLRVTKGDPSDDELAALVAVVAGLASAASAPPPVVRRSEWSAHARKVRRPLQRGQGAWRASAWPR